MERANKIFWKFIIASVIISIVMGIAGVVIHKRCGYYPRSFGDFPAMLKFKGEDLDIPFELQTEDPFNYMSTGLLSTIVLVIWIVNIVISHIINFAEDTADEIISIVSLAIAITLFVLLDKHIIRGKLLPVVLFLVAVLLLYVSYKTIKGTVGGGMMFFATGAFLLHVLAVPLLMKLFTTPIKSIISAIALTILGAVLLIGLGGAGGGSPSYEAHAGNDRERSKMRSELDSINRKIKNKEEGIQKHREGSIDRCFVDEKYAAGEIRDLNKRKDYLEKQLNK